LEKCVSVASNEAGKSQLDFTSAHYAPPSVVFFIIVIAPVLSKAFQMSPLSLLTTLLMQRAPFSDNYAAHFAHRFLNFGLMHTPFYDRKGFKPFIFRFYSGKSVYSLQGLDKIQILWDFQKI